MSDYQGWTNYETWNVVLWVINDETRERDALVEMAKLDRPVTADDAKRISLAVLGGPTPDMTSAEDFEVVDWNQIAAHFEAERQEMMQ